MNWQGKGSRKRRLFRPDPPQLPCGDFVYAKGIGLPAGVGRMSASMAAAQIGRSKGGKKRVRLGVGHFWTKDEARAAAFKSHRKGARRRSARRHFVAVQARNEHTVTSTTNMLVGTWYVPLVKRWYHEGWPVTERVALTHLGYRPRPIKHPIPTEILTAKPGTRLARLVGTGGV